MPEVVRRHGALLAIEDEAGTTEVAARRTLTRRGALKAYAEMRRFVVAPSRPGEELACLVASRVESGRVVEQVRIPFGERGGDDPDAGVREPRRPKPFTGGAAAVAEPGP